ncbi:hypothetical protein WJX84_003030 [Apatococcus fuscideae]|uniref:Uncharacterized protein n=1 Tax=Apatococcus fuscideae TaxID=2026836 RepID=A0AAW1S2Q2_9CHLO
MLEPLPSPYRAAPAGLSGGCNVGVRWRSEGASGPGKRVQDKVVQDPKHIQAAEVRCVYQDGRHEIKSPTEAFKDAARAGMALFSVAPNAKPPVFRIGEPEELIAGQAKKERQAKRRQLDQRRATVMKEMRMRPDTADHDLKMKMARVDEFLTKGHKIRSGDFHWQLHVPLDLYLQDRSE